MNKNQFNIKPIYIKILYDIFYNTPNLQQVILFGSRARGDHKPLSDIDLAISTDNLKAIKYIKSKIEESNILLKVDVVELNSIESQKLIDNIIADGVVIWDRNLLSE